MLCVLLVLVGIGLTGCAFKQTEFVRTYDGFPGEANQHWRIIPAPPEAVFDAITDPNRFPGFCPKGTAVTLLDPLPYQVGTRVETRIDHVLDFVWHSRVEAIEPGRQIRLTFEDGLFAGGVEIWQFEPQEGDKTRLMHTIIVEPKGFIKNAIWTVKARRKHNIMVEKVLDAVRDSFAPAGPEKAAS